MMWNSRMAALAIVLIMGLVVAACAPDQPEGSAAPGTQAGTTPVATAPAGDVAGVQATPEPVGSELAATPTTGDEPARDTPWAATPGVGGIPGSPEGAPGLPRPTPGVGEPTGTRQVTGVDLLIDDIGSFNGRLDGLAGGAILPFTGQRPMPSDLTGMTQQAKTLLRGLVQLFPQMSEEGREEALQLMSDATGTMARVVENYIEETRADIAPTPGPAITPGAAATPGVAAQPVSQDVQQIQTEIQALAGAQPSAQGIVDVLHRMERVLETMSSQSAQQEVSELQSLAESMDDLLGVMESFVEDDYMAAGTGGAPPPTSGAGAVPGGAGASPTPQS